MRRLRSLVLVKYGWFPAAVFLVHSILALIFGLYDRIFWLDIVMHSTGGVAIAYFIANVAVYLNQAGRVAVGQGIAFLLAVFGLVALAAVLWEFAEFITDSVFGINSQRNVVNVMKDQFFGLLGGAAYLLFVRPERRLGAKDY